MRKGFTLIEFMISTVLILAILMSIAVVTISSMRISQLNTNKSIALNHLGVVMEEINSLSFGEIFTRDWSAWAAGKKDSSGAPLFNLENESVSVSATATIPTSILVVISWTDRGRTFTVDASTIKSNI